MTQGSGATIGAHAQAQGLAPPPHGVFAALAQEKLILQRALITYCIPAELQYVSLLKVLEACCRLDAAVLCVYWGLSKVRCLAAACNSPTHDRWRCIRRRHRF